VHARTTERGLTSAEIDRGRRGEKRRTGVEATDEVVRRRDVVTAGTPPVDTFDRRDRVVPPSDREQREQRHAASRCLRGDRPAPLPDDLIVDGRNGKSPRYARPRPLVGMAGSSLDRAA
jgi:hypothetical protein